MYSSGGFFRYLAQMITSITRCVACNDLWPSPISSRLFRCETAYFMGYIHMWPKYNPGGTVSCTISSQGHTGRSHFCSWGWGYPSRSLIYNFLLQLIADHLHHYHFIRKIDLSPGNIRCGRGAIYAVNEAWWSLMQQNWLWEQWDFLCHYEGNVLLVHYKVISWIYRSIPVFTHLQTRSSLKRMSWQQSFTSLEDSSTYFLILAYNSNPVKKVCDVPIWKVMI